MQVKRNVSDLTNIPVRHQQWEGWPASASDDSVRHTHARAHTLTKYHCRTVSRQLPSVCMCMPHMLCAQTNKKRDTRATNVKGQGIDHT